MPFTAFSEINAVLEPIFQTLSSDLPAALAGGVIPLVAAGVSVQVAFHGFAVIRGTGGTNHFLDVFAKAMRAFLVFALCLTGTAYVDNIRPIFEELQRSLMTYVGGPSGDIYTELDAVMQSGITTFNTIHQLLYERYHLSIEIGIGTHGINLDGVPAIILQAIITFFILAFGIFAFIDVMIISQTLVIVLAFGPLFLAGFAFESTAKWAEGWLTSVVKYVLTAVVLLVVVLAARQQAERFVSELSTGASSYALIPINSFGSGPIGLPLYEAQGKLIAILIVLTALLMKASSIAADMVGSMGIASNAIGMARSAKGSAIGAAKGLVQGGMAGGGVKGALKGMALGAAGMSPPVGGFGGGSRPVSGSGASPAGGNRSGSGSASGGQGTQKSFARRAKQRLRNTAAYMAGEAAGRTVGRTALPAMAQQARRTAHKSRSRVEAALRSSDPFKEASLRSSNRAGPALRDAWNRSRRP